MKCVYLRCRFTRFGWVRAGCNGGAKYELNMSDWLLGAESLVTFTIHVCALPSSSSKEKSENENTPRPPCLLSNHRGGIRKIAQKNNQRNDAYYFRQVKVREKKYAIASMDGDRGGRGSFG